MNFTAISYILATHIRIYRGVVAKCLFLDFLFSLIFRSCVLVSVKIRGTTLHIVTNFVWQIVNLKLGGSHKAVTLSRVLLKTAQNNRKFEEHCHVCRVCGSVHLQSLK